MQARANHERYNTTKFLYRSAIVVALKLETLGLFQSGLSSRPDWTRPEPTRPVQSGTVLDGGTLNRQLLLLRADRPAIAVSCMAGTTQRAVHLVGSSRK